MGPRNRNSASLMLRPHSSKMCIRDRVDTIDQLTPDSVITVTGKVMENDYVKMGGVEMIPESIEVESTANALPIVRKEIAATKKKKAVERSSIDQRIDYRWRCV